MTEAPSGLAAYRAARQAGEIPAPARKTPFEKLRENPLSKAQAIVAMCSQCMGWEEGKERPGGVLEDIRNCTASRCPLWAVRPHQQHMAQDEGEDQDQTAAADDE